jgi:type II secretory pathway pseudopilin PulG
MVKRAAARDGEGGFTFLGLLFAVAIASLALAGTGLLWHFEARREKEKELLFIGESYRRAITSYYNASPGSNKEYPKRLEDLLLDTRFPMPVRHLRRLYRDPMTGENDWKLILVQERITGVASRSGGQPIKVAGFASEQAGFEQARSYGDWRFEHGAAR